MGQQEQTNIRIEKLSQGLKTLAVAVFVSAICFGLFAILTSGVEYNMGQDKNLFLLSSAPMIFGFILLYLSIFRLANALNKNAKAWVATSFFIPFVFFFAILYLPLCAISQIIKIKVK